MRYTLSFHGRQKNIKASYGKIYKLPEVIELFVPVGPSVSMKLITAYKQRLLDILNRNDDAPVKTPVLRLEGPIPGAHGQSAHGVAVADINHDFFSLFTYQEGKPVNERISSTESDNSFLYCNTRTIFKICIRDNALNREVWINSEQANGVAVFALPDFCKAVEEFEAVTLLEQPSA